MTFNNRNHTNAQHGYCYNLAVNEEEKHYRNDHKNFISHIYQVLVITQGIKKA